MDAKAEQKVQRLNKSKSALTLRPEALEQSSPRTAHEGKIRLPPAAWQQNLGNQRVIGGNLSAACRRGLLPTGGGAPGAERDAQNLHRTDGPGEFRNGFS